LTLVGLWQFTYTVPFIVVIRVFFSTTSGVSSSILSVLDPLPLEDVCSSLCEKNEKGEMLFWLCCCCVRLFLLELLRLDETEETPVSDRFGGIMGE